jgi:hypothetical protein
MNEWLNQAAGDVFNVKAFGAKGDGVDDTAAILAARAAAGGKQLYFPPGDFVVNATRVEITTSQHWIGAGSGLTTIRFLDPPPEAPSVSLDVYGPDLVEVAEAPETVAEGATAITFASDPGSLSGLLVLRDSAVGSFNSARDEYVAGEIVEIASQATTTVDVRNRVMGEYTASGTFKAFEYDPIEFSAEGIQFEFPEDVNIGLRLRRVHNYHLAGCSLAGAERATVQLGEYCFRGNVRDSYTAMTAAADTEQYGLSLTGVQELSILGGGAQATRHAIAMGGAIIPNRRILVQGGNYTLTSEAQGRAALDCHGNAEYVRFDGNVCGGALLAGDYIAFTNNTVTGKGQGVGIRELLGSHFDVSDNFIQSYFPNPNSTRANGVTFQSGATGDHTTRGGHLRIHDNTIEYTGTARSGIYLDYGTGFAVGSSTEVSVVGNAVRLANEVNVGVFITGLAGEPLRKILCSRNTVVGGGLDLRHAGLTLADDNDVSDGTAQGILLRNIGTSDAAQSVKARRNDVNGCGNAGIHVQGDGDNPFALVRLEGNDLPGNSATNQGSSSLEAAVVAGGVGLLIVNDNTALVAGANQTNDYSFDATVDEVHLFRNHWVVGTVVNNADAVLEDDAQTYTPTNVTTDRAFDADTVLVAELADVVGTLIADLQAARIMK